MLVDPAPPGISRRSQRRNDCLLKDRPSNYFAPTLGRGTIERPKNKRTTQRGSRSDA
jgi:hypothetical protein